jgi:hypothetical protein
MLEKLNTIAWSKLTHAYGRATDVPAQIRKLASRDKDERENALRELYSNIFHQGTRYQATPYAVPFLYELIASPNVPDRHEIVYLLVNLALGYEEWYLPEGLEVAAFRRTLEESDAQLSPADRAECDKYGFGPLSMLDCYNAVRDGTPALVALLTDDDERLRRAAAYALAWFPEQAPQSFPAIRQLLAGESDELNLANAMLVLGLLARSSHQAVVESEWRRFLSSPSLMVRVAAAIALARDSLTDELIEVLIQATLATEHLQVSGDDLHFNEGNLSGYASLVLAHGGATSRSKIVPALCEALKSVNPYQSLNITASLLHLIVGERTTPIKDISPGLLDPLEITALLAIADYGGWRIGGGLFINYSQLVHDYGLPDSQQSLQEYLNQLAK